MNKENLDFLMGILIGVLISCTIFTLVGVIKSSAENSGYENKLVIKYHNPNKAYDREMVQKMVNDSQVGTNFVCMEMKMNKHWIEYHMTNHSK